MKYGKKKKAKLTVTFLILYCLFTAGCCCLSYLIPDQSIFWFRVWYRATAVIWLILVVTATVLIMKILKRKKR